MQTILRPRITVSHHLTPSLRCTRYSRSTQSQLSQIKNDTFSAQRSPLQPTRSTPNHGILRRTFASNRGTNFYEGYASTRTAILGFIGLNAAVFAGWQYAIANQDRSLLTWMSKHFSTSIPNIREGRYYTLLTSAFSHQTLIHFAFNMMAFYAFGTITAVVGIGGARLASLCIGSGIAGSTAWLYQQYNSSSSLPRKSAALGASGVVMGAGAAATCLVPFAPMQLMFIPINIPLWMVMLGYAGLDTYYLRSSSTVGHAAHLGGGLFGALFYVLSLRRFGGVARMFGGGLRR